MIGSTECIIVYFCSDELFYPIFFPIFVRDVSMDFSYGSAFAEESPEAYERLILDVLLGEPSLFPVATEVELSWKILDPALAYWAAHGTPDPYESGTWGPDSAVEMLARSGRSWRRP